MPLTTARSLRWGAALICTAVLGIALPYLVTSYWLSLTTLALVLCVFAASINLLAGYGGMVTIGQAGTLATAGYAAAYLSTRHHASFLVQIVGALAVVVLLSAVFGAMAVRTRGVYFLMVTLAQGMVIWGLSSSLSVTGGGDGIPNVSRPPLVSGAQSFYYLCLVVAVATLAIIALIVASPFGLGLRAIKANEERAAAVGYNTTLVRFLAFVVSGIIAGVAGILFVYLNEFISPSAAYFQMSADGMVMALIGGLGTVAGPAVGAVVLVLIKNVLSAHVERWPTVEGVFFVLMVLYARQGLVGLVKDSWRRLGPRRKKSPPTPRPDGAGHHLDADQHIPPVDAKTSQGTTTPDIAQSGTQRTLARDPSTSAVQRNEEL